jgi:N-acetylglucosaminyldiphosphoundecaprenol N-acetyl-beta-D-mannosaminyltransferase
VSVALASRPDTARGLERRCRERTGWTRVNGVRIDSVTPDGFLDTLSTFLSCGQSHVVHFCAAHPTVEARRDPTYRELLNKGALNVADGMPVAWAARMCGSSTERLAGPDSMGLVAAWGVERGLRHYLFGGTPATLERLQRRLEERYPGILIVGAEAPPFRPMTDDEVAEAARRIQDAGAQTVWVGLGAPKQDFTAHRFRVLHAAPVTLCVGAAFDFVAGTLQRAPLWMRRSGLEWVHRFAAEPRRLWRRYLIGNAEFVVGVARDQLGRLLSSMGRHPS